jgi:hypothetical protein
MNLRVDDLLNADRYYTTAVGRPNNRIQPTLLGGDQDRGNFGGGSRPPAFLPYQGGAADTERWAGSPERSPRDMCCRQLYLVHPAPKLIRVASAPSLRTCTFLGLFHAAWLLDKWMISNGYLDALSLRRCRDAA